MKVFVGNVNGQTFDNEYDFKIAAAEALLKGDTNQMCISSYFKETVDVKKNEYVSISDITPKDDKYTLPEDSIQKFHKLSEENVKELADFLMGEIKENEKLYCELKAKTDDTYKKWNYYKTISTSLEEFLPDEYEVQDNSGCDCGSKCDCKRQENSGCDCDKKDESDELNPVGFIQDLLKGFPEYLNSIGFWDERRKY